MSMQNYFQRICQIGSELGIPVDHCASRGIALCEEATELESVGLDIYQREQYLIPAAAKAWRTLQAEAWRAGIELQLVSAFRSVDYQRGIIERKLASGQSMEQILDVSAVPGYSEHHTGRAVDLTTPGVDVLTEAFETTAAFAWLTEHAGEYGFVMSYPRGNSCGYAFEPWHWCYRATSYPG